MKEKLRIMLAAASIVAVVLVAVFATSGSAATTVKVRVVEHATTDAVHNIGSSNPGDSAGDVLTFHNHLFKAGKRVGRDIGTCVRIVAGRSWECAWTNLLKGGHIDVAGPFYDTHDSTLSVTGGTGIYKHATGQMHLHAVNGGKAYVFTFTLKIGA
jgi:allene oxide cyclase